MCVLVNTIVATRQIPKDTQTLKRVVSSIPISKRLAREEVPFQQAVQPAVLAVVNTAIKIKGRSSLIMQQRGTLTLTAHLIEDYIFPLKYTAKHKSQQQRKANGNFQRAFPLFFKLIFPYYSRNKRSKSFGKNSLYFFSYKFAIAIIRKFLKDFQITSGKYQRTF